MRGQVKTQVEFTELEAASRKLDIALEVADMKSPGDLDGAFSTMIGKRVGALLVVVSPLTYLLKESIAEGRSSIGCRRSATRTNTPRRDS